jgi:hypothetical protein
VRWSSTIQSGTRRLAIAANGGNVTIRGSLHGAGKAEIFSNSQMELQSADNSGSVSFENNSGDTGLFVLDHSAIGSATGFKGTIRPTFRTSILPVG